RRGRPLLEQPVPLAVRIVGEMDHAWALEQGGERVQALEELLVIGTGDHAPDRERAGLAARAEPNGAHGARNGLYGGPLTAEAGEARTAACGEAEVAEVDAVHGDHAPPRMNR